MIELSNYRQIHAARRAAGTGSATAARAATLIAALGATALLPLVTQPAMAAPPVQQAASPPARAGQAAPGGTAFAGTPQDAAAAVHAAIGVMKAPRVIPAVQADVWNDLAMCESSGNWHINSGNGFYGGLQFWQPTWERFGGTRYARRADLATRGHQITIARSVLREQGWKAWPVCSRKLGLGDDAPIPGGTPDQPGGTPVPGQVPAPDPDQELSAARAPGGAQGDGKNRRTHTVLPGETLSGIAKAAHVRGGWRRLYAVNRQVVGPDPDRLQAGAVLTLP